MIKTPPKVDLVSDQFDTSRHPKRLLNRVVCGDALSVMRRMASSSVDLVITSPPYNIRNSTGNGLKNGRGGKWENAALQRGYTHHDDCMQHDEYVAWQRECLAEMLRIVASDGAIFYNHKWRVQGGLLQFVIRVGIGLEKASQEHEQARK